MSVPNKGVVGSADIEVDVLIICKHRVLRVSSLERLILFTLFIELSLSVSGEGVVDRILFVDSFVPIVVPF